MGYQPLESLRVCVVNDGTRRLIAGIMLHKVPGDVAVFLIQAMGQEIGHAQAHVRIASNSANDPSDWD